MASPILLFAAGPLKAVFWAALLSIVYTYAGYPLAMWAWARLRPRRWRQEPAAPTVSVVLAVHNGLDMLPWKIDHLLHLDYANIQDIIIVSDGSTDGTAEYLRSLQNPRVTSVVLSEHGGKAAALNAGVARAAGEIVLFMDIRPESAPGAIARMVRNFADPKVGCVSGQLVLRQDGHDAAAAAVGGLYWKYEQWIRQCEAAVDSPVGVYGGFYAIRRSLAVPQPDGLILDDMFQPLAIIRQGYRSVFDDSALVYDTWPKKVGGEFQRKVRTLAGNFQLFRKAPWTLAPGNRVLFQLLSHKVMRLVVPYCLILLLLSSWLLAPRSAAYAAVFAAQVAGWALAIAGLKVRIPVLGRLAAPAGALMVLNAAAVVGLYKFLFTSGPLWKIWVSDKPAHSAQGGSVAQAACQVPASARR